MNDKALDSQSLIRSVDISGESSYPKEDIEQPDYSDYEGDVPYREEYIWSLDTSLAIFLDKTLTGIMGHPYTYPIYGMKEARDTFRLYANKEYSDSFLSKNSVEYKALMKALDWLKDNFTGLWT